MKNPFLFISLALSAMFLSATAAATGVKQPADKPTLRGSAMPKLLSPYERKTLQLEYAKLVREIREKRAEAAQDPSLDELKARVASETGAAGQAPVGGTTAVRELSDAVEARLYSFPGIPAKIKRLQEVGRLLEYDLRLRREQRAAESLGKVPGGGEAPQTAVQENES